MEEAGLIPTVKAEIAGPKYKSKSE